MIANIFLLRNTVHVNERIISAIHFVHLAEIINHKTNKLGLSLKHIKNAKKQD